MMEYSSYGGIELPQRETYRSGEHQSAFKKSTSREPSQVQVFVEGLPLNVQIKDVVRYFSTVGRIKLDRESRSPRVWLYKNKVTGELTGEATITYVNRETQNLALESYNGRLFMNRYLLKVTPAIVKSHMASPPILPPRPSRGMSGRGFSGTERGRGNFRGGYEKRESGDNRNNFQSYRSQQGYKEERHYSNY